VFRGACAKRSQRATQRVSQVISARIANTQREARQDPSRKIDIAIAFLVGDASIATRRARVCVFMIAPHAPQLAFEVRGARALVTRSSSGELATRSTALCSHDLACGS
jgi:hypothetical protein